MTIDPIELPAETHATSIETLIQNWDPEQDLHKYLGQAQHRLALEIIDAEVNSLCGLRYAHDGLHDGCYQRWGSNPDSIKIRSERFPICVPRVRDLQSKKSVLCGPTKPCAAPQLSSKRS